MAAARSVSLALAVCLAPSLQFAISPVSAQPKTPETYYTAPPESIIDQMRQTPRPRNGMGLTELSALDKVVSPRALACDSMFNEDVRMQERIRSWPRSAQIDLANECRRIIADYNAMQPQLAQLKRLEQERAQQREQEQAARRAAEAREAEAARAAEQRAAFMARRPDFLLVLNTEAKAFEITRTLDGSTRITQKGGPVAAQFVRASAQSSSILLDRYEKLPPLWLNEIKSLAGELARARGLTLDTRGLEAREIRTGAARKCVGEASAQATRGSGSGSGSPPQVLDRVCRDLTVGLIDQAERARIKPLIDRGSVIVLGEIRSGDLQARLDAAAKREAERAAAEEAKRQEIIAQFGSKPNHFLAIILPANKAAASCTIKSRKIEGAVRSAGGYLSLPDFTKAARLKPDWRFDELADDLEKLWTLVQQSKCSGVIVTGAEAAQVLPAFDRDKLRYTLLPLREASELHPAYASARGFASVAQLDFAVELKASRSDVQSLAEFGITDLAGHRAATGRMQKSGYSKTTEIEDLTAFLRDEAEGAKIKRTAIQIREARLAAAEARDRERAEQLRRELPLYSVQLMCMEPMGHMTETLVGHLARSPAVFIQMITGSLSRFCQQLALPISNPDLITSARRVASDASGADYFVTKAPDGRSVLGLIKRRGN
ncbi:MAG: hypothetical protein RL322_2006 [Pseudomonadota bacterium]